MLKNGLNLLFVALIVVMIASCGKQEKELKTEEEYLTSAKSLYDSGLVKNDNELFNQSIKKYQEFVSKFPKSEKVLFAYNQIAGINFDNLKNYPEAINTYKIVVDKYPDKKEAKQSLFMIAFIYDETMKDKENAKIYYKKFIEKYPTDTDANDKMTESAKRMLEVLESGKSIEELILQNSDNKTSETKTDTKQDSKKEEKKTEVKKTQTIDDGNVDRAPEQKKK
ncbi:MAG: tetratricopeptide repeat protein [Ignavibacteriota bacterium]|nr:tetratricopeptide repeat protein [Ignavibacteriota bacterium]